MYNTRAINLVKAPQTQACHVKQSITHFVKIRVHKQSLYFCIISKPTGNTALPSIILIQMHVENKN